MQLRHDVHLLPVLRCASGTSPEGIGGRSAEGVCELHLSLRDNSIVAPE